MSWQLQEGFSYLYSMNSILEILNISIYQFLLEEQPVNKRYLEGYQDN